MRAALQVTQQELATGDVIGEVAQGLHGVAPRVPGVGDPAGVAVELLEVEYEGLHQGLAPVAPVLPYLRLAHEDAAVHDVGAVPVVDDVLGAVDDVELLLEVVVLEHGAALELLGDARLARPGARDVAALPHVLEGPGREEAVPVDVGRRGVVGPGARHGWPWRLLLRPGGMTSMTKLTVNEADALEPCFCSRAKWVAVLWSSSGRELGCVRFPGVMCGRCILGIEAHTASWSME